MTTRANVSLLDTTGSAGGNVILSSNGVAIWSSIDFANATSGNSTLFNGQAAAFYQNASNLTTGTLSSAVIPTTIAHGLTLTGDLSHTGLVPTVGTNIDQIKSVTDTLTLSTVWQDTSINATDLATGTYIVQVLVSDLSAGGTQNTEYYSGIMSWYSGDTDSTTSEELVLHRAGISPGGNSIFLRVARTTTADTDDMKLQITSTNTDAAASSVAFKFRRVI